MNSLVQKNAVKRQVLFSARERRAGKSNTIVVQTRCVLSLAPKLPGPDERMCQTVSQLELRSGPSGYGESVFETHVYAVVMTLARQSYVTSGAAPCLPQRKASVTK